MKYDDPQTAINAGGDALRSQNRFPWYDPVKDGLRQVNVRPPETPLFFQYNPTWSFLVFFTALTILAAALVALVLMLFRAARLRREQAKVAEALLFGEAQRIEALPYPVARAELSLLDQARNCYEAGNYAAAMIYLFSHQLVELDRGRIIRLAKGKTNRQLLREVAGHSRSGSPLRLGQLLGQTLVGFEDAFFGHHEIDRRRFEGLLVPLAGV